MADTTYTIRYSCSNCGYSGYKRLPKGQKAHADQVCDNCGCSTADPNWIKLPNAWESTMEVK